MIAPKFSLLLAIGAGRLEPATNWRRTRKPRCGLIMSVALVACGTATPQPGPGRSAQGAVTPTPTAASAAATVAAAHPAPAPPEPEDSTHDNFAGTLDRDAPPTPCDFARYYRGTIGKARVSIVLSRTGSALRGYAAYDAGFGELDVRGTVGTDGSVTLTERGGGKVVGTLRGSCDPATGTITGTWAGAGKTIPASLAPREAGGVALKEHRRFFGDPREDEPSCHWDVRSLAVFGLGDPGRTARINAALRFRFDGGSEAEMERAVRRCNPGTDNHVIGWYSIEHNLGGLLSVLRNGYVYLGPAAHGWFNAGADAISVDVPTGRRLLLTDVVTSSRAIRPVVRSCMELTTKALDPRGDMGGDPWWWERAIQGVPADPNGEPVEERSPDFDPRSVYPPSFLVLPDGLAVLIRNQPTVAAGVELKGPVVRWGALLRDGVLKPGSPVARLWKGEQPLAPGERACTRFFEPRWSKRIPITEVSERE